MDKQVFKVILVSHCMLELGSYHLGYWVSCVLQAKMHDTQGRIKFEISWEPNFPVNYFARINGEKRIITQTIINVKL